VACGFAQKSILSLTLYCSNIYHDLCQLHCALSVMLGFAALYPTY
jgi:hypothetical protein